MAVLQDNESSVKYELYRFSGMGSYSSSHGWDSGLTTVEIEENPETLQSILEAKESIDIDTLMLEAAREDSNEIENSDLMKISLKEQIVTTRENHHGGAHNVDGFVILKKGDNNLEKAQSMLDGWVAENYPVIEYDDGQSQDTDTPPPEAPQIGGNVVAQTENLTNEINGKSAHK